MSFCCELLIITVCWHGCYILIKPWTYKCNADETLCKIRVWSIVSTLQEENFHWNLNFAISLTANPLNLNSAYYYIFYKSLKDSLCNWCLIPWVWPFWSRSLVQFCEYFYPIGYAIWKYRYTQYNFYRLLWSWKQFFWSHYAILVTECAVYMSMSFEIRGCSSFTGCCNHGNRLSDHTMWS